MSGKVYLLAPGSSVGAIALFVLAAIFHDAKVKRGALMEAWAEKAEIIALGQTGDEPKRMSAFVKEISQNPKDLKEYVYYMATTYKGVFVTIIKLNQFLGDADKIHLSIAREQLLEQCAPILRIMYYVGLPEKEGKEKCKSYLIYLRRHRQLDNIKKCLEEKPIWHWNNQGPQNSNFLVLCQSSLSLRA